MKRRDFFNKTTACLLAIGMSIVLFAGCQNSSSNGASQVSGNKTQNGNRPSQEQMKKTIQDSIQPLVTAGTITQDQADKIIAAYTTRPIGNGQNKPQDKPQNNQQGNAQRNGQNGQNRQKRNLLSKLVNDNVITQAQADTVAQKIKENPKNNNTKSSN